jgi:hypothetical protein
MKPESVKEIFTLVENHVARQPSAMEFEFAYQARVAIDHLRCAIKASEQSMSQSENRQIAFRLLDALDRLESAETSFQQKFRSGAKPVGSRQASAPGSDMALSAKGD